MMGSLFPGVWCPSSEGRGQAHHATGEDEGLQRAGRRQEGRRAGNAPPVPMEGRWLAISLSLRTVRRRFRMERRAFLGTLPGGFVAAPVAAQAQPAGKVKRLPDPLKPR